MPSTFSQSLRIELIGAGEQSGTWNITTNNNLGSLIEQAISGNTPLDVTLGNITLTALNGVVDQSRSAVLSVSGTPGTTRVITIPNVTKLYTVRNVSDSTVQIKTASGVAYSVPAAAQADIFCDGNNAITGRTITDGANTILSQANPFNNAALTGVPTAPTAAVTTNNTQIATTAFVRSIIPAGVILMWSGSIASIPAGWALCNGSGGTPDLRDRFIVGAGSSYAVGATGGANTVTLDVSQIPSHNHSGTTGNQSNDHTHGGSGTTSSVDINHSHNGSGTTSGFSNDHVHSGSTASENQNHTHTFSVNTGGQSQNHTHYFVTNGVGDHTHSYNTTLRTSGFDVEDGNSFVLYEAGTQTGGAGAHAHDGNTGLNNQDHYHGVNGTTAGISNNHQHAFTTGGASSNHTHNYSFTTGGMNSNNVHSHTYSFTTGGVSANHTHNFTTSSTGGSGAHENRPPYYALAYIQKL